MLFQSTAQAAPPAMATAGTNMVMEILNSEEQFQLQPTLLPIVSQHEPVTPEKNHPLVICPHRESPLRS